MYDSNLLSEMNYRTCPKAIINVGKLYVTTNANIIGYLIVPRLQWKALF